MKKIKFKKRCSIFLAFMMFLVISTGSIFADDSTSSYSTKSILNLDPETNNGVFLIENLNIDGKDYTFTHSQENDQKIIQISGAETHTIMSDSNQLYLDNKQISQNKASTGGWTNFGPVTQRVSWKASTSTAVIAAIIGNAVGGPVGGFMSVASILAGASTGCKLVTTGKYRMEGTHVRGNYKTKVYEPGGRYLSTVSWSGYR